MAYRLAVDLGTAYSAAAVANGMPPTVVGLGNRAMQVPSVLYVNDDGTFAAGEIAERRGLADPGRVAREFKRRLGDPVPMIVGGAAFSAEMLMARQLRWIVDTTSERQGSPPDDVVLTYPANWGPYKLGLLDQVAALADLDTVGRISEPEAAASQYAAQTKLAPGERIVVYDLGGGTFDVCVLAATGSGFEILGRPDGVEHLGGADFDEALRQHVLRAVGPRIADLDPDEPAVTTALARLRRECVEAKEALSAEVDATIAVSLPGVSTSIRVTRAEFEAAIRPALQDTITATRRAIRSANLGPHELRAIVLVGGSSRIPLVAELLQREFGIPIAVDTHPKHDIVLGAVRAAAPVRTSPPSPAAAAVGSPPEPPHPAPPVALGEPGTSSGSLRPTSPGSASPTPPAADDHATVWVPSLEAAPTPADDGSTVWVERLDDRPGSAGPGTDRPTAPRTAKPLPGAGPPVWSPQPASSSRAVPATATAAAGGAPAGPAAKPAAMSWDLPAPLPVRLEAGGAGDRRRPLADTWLRWLAIGLIVMAVPLLITGEQPSGKVSGGYVLSAAVGVAAIGAAAVDARRIARRPARWLLASSAVALVMSALMLVLGQAVADSSAPWWAFRVLPPCAVGLMGGVLLTRRLARAAVWPALILMGCVSLFYIVLAGAGEL